MNDIELYMQNMVLNICDSYLNWYMGFVKVVGSKCMFDIVFRELKFQVEQFCIIVVEIIRNNFKNFEV